MGGLFHGSLVLPLYCDLLALKAAWEFWHSRFYKDVQKKKFRSKKTYNSRYSLVVTHPTTNLPI